MQSLEWAFIAGRFVSRCVVIGCGSHHSSWQIAISEVQRRAIYADNDWNDGDIDPEHPPIRGLAVARQMAMISYRSAHSYRNKFNRERNNNEEFEVQSYLEHQVKRA
jgi:homoserine O-acetyltransferase/O-succinyltransferase